MSNNIVIEDQGFVQIWNKQDTNETELDCSLSNLQVLSIGLLAVSTACSLTAHLNKTRPSEWYVKLGPFEISFIF